MVGQVSLPAFPSAVPLIFFRESGRATIGHGKLIENLFVDTLRIHGKSGSIVETKGLSKWMEHLANIERKFTKD
jgi:hypothetical protein